MTSRYDIQIKWGMWAVSDNCTLQCIDVTGCPHSSIYMKALNSLLSLFSRISLLSIADCFSGDRHNLQVSGVKEILCEQCGQQLFSEYQMWSVWPTAHFLTLYVVGVTNGYMLHLDIIDSKTNHKVHEHNRWQKHKCKEDDATCSLQTHLLLFIFGEELSVFIFAHHHDNYLDHGPPEVAKLIGLMELHTEAEGKSHHQASKCEQNLSYEETVQFSSCILIMSDKVGSINATVSTVFISFIIHPYRYTCNLGLVQLYITIYHNYSTHFHPLMRVAQIMFGFKFWQGTAAKEFKPCSL